MPEQMKIYLVRHGKPAINKSVWVTKMNLVHFAKFMKNYRNISITPDREMAVKVAGIIPVDALFISSDLKRTVQTATAVTDGAEFKIDKLFREVSLPLVHLPGTAMCSHWWGLSVALRICGLGGKGENAKQAKLRVTMAVAQLSKEAMTRDVALFGHGVMNYFIAKKLLSSGWSGFIPRKIKHWDVMVLTKTIVE